ncbi:hypothetical protein [Desulfurivibrio alkaliphilus]|uniref:hypothetical protein n=1 Tax=Desulfurivibrio alkaliphilus TaxID=427923 RepID=UPI0005A06791|nr:hypothetical protein [Desulfurivibrio alkaliphilus]
MEVSFFAFEDKGYPRTITFNNLGAQGLEQGFNASPLNAGRSRLGKNGGKCMVMSAVHRTEMILIGSIVVNGIG